GDGFTVDGGDCDDGNRDVNPDAVEVCNGIDDNCDRRVDDVRVACYSGPPGTAGVGVCVAGEQTCVDGALSGCNGEVLPAPEACGNNLDEDCNGQVDDGCNLAGCPDVPLNTPVTVSSACLTANSGARAVISVDIADPAVDVDIAVQPAAALGPIQRQGGTVYRVVTAPANAGQLTVSVTLGCDAGQRVALQARPVIQVAPAVAYNGNLVTGGCGLDGNLRVRMVAAESGAPIADGFAMVGPRPGNILQPDAAAALRGAAPAGSNVARTDAAGVALFTDFADGLSGGVTVTVGAAGRENVTLFGFGGSVVVVPVREMADNRPAEATLRGALTDFDNLARDGQADMGLVMGSFDLAFLATLALPRLLSRFDCWDAVTQGLPGQLVPPAAVPGNLYVPQQGETLLGFPVTVEEHRFALFHYPQAGDELVALAGKVPVDQIAAQLSAGQSDLSALVQLLTPREMGVLRGFAVAGDRNDVSVPLAAALAENATCEAQDAPADTGVICVAAGDWQGGDGTGRLFPMGIASADPQQVDDARA
ncbi:MAG: putative metal-binding motif-containing protein, partial [Myxococcales bacterium]|nr:putative metal-binding motif-containing protein [Myxococcales bacterium]